MANLIMTNWRVKDTYPYYMLGSAGENNATQIIITVDELIENGKYYLDIGDENGSGLPNTQELTPNTSVGTNGESIYTLSMKPLISWLGREGVKLLQVRCVYFDEVQIVKESNVFHGTVDRNSGFVYKYNIAVFEQYLNKINKDMGEYATKDDVLQITSKKQDIIQYNTLPLASDSTLGDIYQYVGETNENYTKGAFYKCIDAGVSPNHDYRWIVVKTDNIPIDISGGQYSIIENDLDNNVAMGDYAHAEGIETQAVGDGSHAEGSNTSAQANYSHAEGDHTIATGLNSHTEGQSTTASGNNGHAEGNATSATGGVSHAEGQNTQAKANFSHSQNYGTSAKGFCQTVIGEFNIEQGSLTSRDITDYALIIGNGVNNSNRSNALAVQWDGNVVFQDGSKQNSAAISITDLKTLVASCSDFADFKTQIASL